MKLSAYVQACLDNPKTKIEKQLELDDSDGDSVLCPAAILATSKASEKAAVEYGMNLYWDSTKSQIKLGKLISQSKATMVNLGSKTEVVKKDYIGDLHTHPYKLKMGEKAEMGFSAEDIDGFFKFPPNHMSLAVHIVISYHAVFMIIRRDLNIKLDEKNPWSGLPYDGAMIRETRDNHPQLKALMEDAYEISETAKSAQAQKAAWDKYAPKFAQELSATNRAMNIAMAQKKRYDYYHCANIKTKNAFVLIS